MKGERRKTTEEEIKEAETLIVNNSKDARFAKGLIQKLRGLYQMNKLIDVPLKDVTDNLDFGANVLYKVRDGYVWECKGGMTTHVSVRMSRVCAMLNTIFELHNKEDKTEEEQSLYDSFSTAAAYIFQCPIFSSLDERALFQNATAILNAYTEFCTDNFTNAEAVDETEEDIKENIQDEQMANALETLANAPLPPEDKDE